MIDCLRRLGVLLLFALASATEPAAAGEAVSAQEAAWHRFLGRFQDDYLGSFFYSRTNFTDLKGGRPYDGFDGFGVAKFSLWADDAHTFGAFVQGIPVVTTEDAFFFQRYVQGDLGLQFYPFEFFARGASPRWTRAIRLFGQQSRRAYYDDRGVDLVTRDTQVGVDYYYDNLFADPRPAMLFFVFTNASWRETNFSFSGYDAFVWIGNVKVGPRVGRGPTLVPYVVADWVSVPKYPERWFENRLGLGGGVRFYPFVADQPEGTIGELRRRFHLFAEALGAVWLGHEPPRSVKNYDVRIGLSFSTGGFFRDTR